MTESSILSTQRQKYINPNDVLHSDNNINYQTIQELMIISDQIMSKWRQSTPNIDRLLHDLKDVIKAINFMINKLDHNKDSSSLAKHITPINKNSNPALKSIPKQPIAQRDVFYAPPQHASQTPVVANHAPKPSLDNQAPVPPTQAPIAPIPKTPSSTPQHTQASDLYTTPQDAPYKPAITLKNRQAPISDNKNPVSADHEKVQNIAHSIQYKNANIINKDNQQYTQGIGHARGEVFQKLTQNDQPVLKNSLQNYAPFVQSDRTGRFLQDSSSSISSNINLKLQLQTVGEESIVKTNVIPNIMDLLMVSQLGRIASYDNQLLTSYNLINARSTLLNDIQKNLSLARVDQPTGNKKAALPDTVVTFMEKEGLTVPSPTNKDLTANEYEAYVQSLDSLLSKYNSESQLELLQLQRIISYRNQAFEIITNTISRILKTRDTIISNIR